MEYKRLTKKVIDCFQYDLKDFKHKIGEFGDYDAFFAYSMAVKKLGELEDKIEAGTLVELPCKVGDVAYTRYGGCINKWEVSEIDIFDFDILVKLEHTGTLGWTTAYLSEVGDRLFFNKAEAEKRLEEIKNGNNDRLSK